MHFLTDLWTKYGVMLALLIAGCCTALPGGAATFFKECEEFTVTGDGWSKDQSSQGWEVVSLQKKASRAAALWGAQGAGDSLATTRLTAPVAGEYRLHVRYLLSPVGRGPFRVTMLQGGKEVAGKDFDLAAAQTPGGWEYIWESFDVRLDAGDAVIQISKYKQQNCTGYARYVDCVLLTDDKTLVPDHIPYGPQIFLRVTLGDGYEKPVYVHIFADHYRDPWYEHLAISKDGIERRISPANAKAFFTNNERSGWVNLTPTIYQDSGALLQVTARFDYWNTAPRFKAKFEFATAPDETKIVKTLQRDASPGGVYIIVPPDLRPQNLAKLQMDIDIATATGKRADAMTWPTFGKKPVLFPYFASAHFDGGWVPVDRQVTEREQKTLDYFGFTNKTKERIGGLWHLKDNCYSQPDTKAMTDGAKSAAEQFAKHGKVVANIANCMLMDEPTGQPLSHLANCPACTEQFRQWMRELHPTPAALGMATWEEVKPIEEAQREKLPALYYYSQRFRTRALSKFMRAQRELLQQAYGSTAFPVNVNFSDGATYHANFFSQGVDYFELMENDDQNAIWGEDWANGAASPQCSSYNVELMRSAAMQRGQMVGHYLIAYAGRLPWDIQLNAISQVARDVKVLENFWYGPSWAGHEGGPPWNCSGWYAKPETWYANAAIARVIGGAEDLLISAKKKKAEVAILYASSADIWSISRTFSYGFDRMFIWTALTHAHVPVDFVSEQSVAEGRLDGYKVCYFSGRNLTQAAARQLTRWVNGGGTLVLTAGAGAHDEYNRPMAILDEILPAAYGKLDEFQHYQASGAYLHVLKPKEQVTMQQGGVQCAVLSVKQELQPKAEAQVLGAFADGAPAVVKRASGAGVVYAYGFLPGLAYMWPAVVAKQQVTAEAGKRGTPPTAVPAPSATVSSADLLRRSWCPWQYPAAVREVIAGTALQAKASQPVFCNVPLVDAVCMEAEKGLVAPLANYTLQPLKTVTLAVASAKPVRYVESVRQGKLAFKQEAGRVRFALPLQESDIVKLYY